MALLDSQVRDRVRGALIGLAVGDALGTALEFKPPGSFPPLADMIGGGPFHLQPGEWTDDTSMALCLAESLVECQRFDAVDQLGRYVRWRNQGHMSSNGRCFDIGIQTRAALEEFQETGQSRCGPTAENCAGNGSLMRLAPVPMAFHAEVHKAIACAAESSRTTHGNTACVDACRYFAGLLAGAFQGTGQAELLGDRYGPAADLWNSEPLSPGVAAVAGGSFLRKDPPAIRGAGYVVDCLEAALWAFARTDSFEAAVLQAVNLGDDADTTGAVCGQIAGAFYGAAAIPAKWRQRLALRETIETLSDRLADMGGLCA